MLYGYNGIISVILYMTINIYQLHEQLYMIIPHYIIFVVYVQLQSHIIRTALLVDGESKAINYLLHGEYELNKTSWSKLQKKYNVSRNKIYAALKGKGRPGCSQYWQNRKQMVKPEATASTSHYETVND